MPISIVTETRQEEHCHLEGPSIIILSLLEFFSFGVAILTNFFLESCTAGCIEEEEILRHEGHRSGLRPLSRFRVQVFEHFVQVSFSFIVIFLDFHQLSYMTK